MADNKQDEVVLDPMDLIAELAELGAVTTAGVKRSDGRPGMEEQIAGATIAADPARPVGFAELGDRPPVNERLRTPPPRPTVTVDPAALAALVDTPDPPPEARPRQSSETVLAEANEVIHGERAAEYGPAEESFARIAQLWSVYLGRPLDAYDVALMMVLMKVSRATTDLKRDTAVDIAGYAALMPRCAVAAGRRPKA